MKNVLNGGYFNSNLLSKRWGEPCLGVDMNERGENIEKIEERPADKEESTKTFNRRRNRTFIVGVTWWVRCWWSRRGEKKETVEDLKTEKGKKRGTLAFLPID